MRLRYLTFFALAGALLLPTDARGQDPLELGGDRTLVDRVAAVVGDSVILLTELEERFLQLQASGAQIPEDPGALEQIRRDLLETLVNEQLVIQAAARDTTLAVPPDRVNQVVEEELERRIQSFGSRTAFQEALTQAGMTTGSFRENLRRQARRRLLMEQYLARTRQQAAEVPVSESEMREFFESQRQGLQERPATVTFAQVVVRPEPTDSAENAARVEAQRVLEMVRSGEQDFETLARRFSEDPGTRQQGGDLGWFRRGQMVPEFEDVAFALQDGQVSPVVETPFGFHIIRVERSRGPERKARHILIRPETTEEDVEAARELAGELQERIAGEEPLADLQARYNPEDTPDSMDIALDRLDQLPPGYGDVLRDAREGQVLGPVRWEGGANTVNFSVLKILEVREAGAFTFEDVRDQVESTLRQQKLQERMLEELRRGTYVEIRI